MCSECSNSLFFHSMPFVGVKQCIANLGRISFGPVLLSFASPYGPYGTAYVYTFIERKSFCRRLSSKSLLYFRDANRNRMYLECVLHIHRITFNKCSQNGLFLVYCGISNVIMTKPEICWESHVTVARAHTRTHVKFGLSSSHSNTALWYACTNICILIAF